VAAAAERVAAVAGERKAPTRLTPLDGLTPLDFDRKWPQGLVVKPVLFRQRGLSPAQEQIWLNAVRNFQQLARDYVYYLGWRGVTQDALARELKVSSNRLSAFRQGRGWPSGPLVVILRSVVPREEYMREHTFDGEKRAP